MEIQLIYNIIKRSKKIVFFGGAGTSTESGIPDFRSSKGLYKKTAEELVSNRYFRTNPNEFFEFFKENLFYPDSKFNLGHKILANWEKEGKLLGIITQNIDRLHQKAGSKNVIELHGNVYEYYCNICKKEYNKNIVIDNFKAPKCECGGYIRPNVVLFGESLSNNSIEKAIGILNQAELLIVAGTSLIVQPAASMINYFKGKNKILINNDATVMDSLFDIVMREGFTKSMNILNKSMEIK